MIFDNEFAVDLGIDRAWELLTDLATIAPCLPGAELTGVKDEQFTGNLLVKVGPMSSRFTGTAALRETDPTVHRAVIVAQGMDTKGAGTARAEITATLRPHGAGSIVAVHTDLRISGKFAQFGSSVLQQVSANLLDEFAGNVAARFAADPHPKG